MRALSSMSRAHAVHDGHSLGQGCVRAVCVVTRSGLDGSTGLQPHPAQLPPPPLARQPATPPPEQRMWRPSRAVLRLAARHLQNPVAGEFGRAETFAGAPTAVCDLAATCQRASHEHITLHSRCVRTLTHRRRARGGLRPALARQVGRRCRPPWPVARRHGSSHADGGRGSHAW
jgi:hypothetical protein